MGGAEILGVKMGRLYIAVICLLLAACKPVPPNPVASPLPGASQKPSLSPSSTTQSPSLQPSASALPTPTAFPSPTPVPTYSEEPIPIRTLPPEARPTPLPEPPLLSSALTVLAGSDAPGFQDGKGEEARFQGPQGLDLDLQGNLYVADTENHAIRKISPQGEVSTIAGMGQAGDADGLAKQAQFRYPQRLTLDNAGHIFVIENIALEKDPATGQLRYMNVPVLQRIRKVNLSEQKVTQLILSNSDVLKKRVLDIVWHSSEKKLYISGANTVLQIQDEFNVTPITHDKTFEPVNIGADYGSARFSYSSEPSLNGIVSQVDLLFLTDFSNKIIWKISLNGKPSFLAGGTKHRGEGFYPDSCGDFALFFSLNSLSSDNLGNLFIGESTWIRKVTPDGCVSTIRTNKKDMSSGLYEPFDFKKISDLVWASPNILYILSENKIYKLDLNARAPS